MRGALVLLLVAAPLSVTAAPAARGAHPEGQYGGVTPGEPGKEGSKDAAGKDAASKPKRQPAKGTLTWIGFEAKDGGAEVFFQSVAPFTISQRVEAGSVIVHLDLPRLGHNTWRQIDTRFFDNPLSGIAAKAVGAVRASKGRPARGAGIEAKIAFKNARDAREATVRTATEADGMYYAYLTFGEGSASEGPGDAVPPPVEAAPAAPSGDDAPADEPKPAKPGKPQRQESDSDLPPDLPKSK
ncbi:MAG TPA: hypothetical protein VFP84_26585 [Kofleriaceae bacterium]|nr:hypothetical protein [Kofleriaceae bacterium]